MMTKYLSDFSRFVKETISAGINWVPREKFIGNSI